VIADDNEDGEEECAGVLEICQLDHVKFPKWEYKHVIDLTSGPCPIGRGKARAKTFNSNCGLNQRKT